jgi:hypothetical protein
LAWFYDINQTQMQMKAKRFLPSFLTVEYGRLKPGTRAKTGFRPIVWGPLFLTFAFAQTGHPAPINILDAQYTTGLSANCDDIETAGTTNVSGIHFSPVSISDSMNDPGSGQLSMQANAGLFGIVAQTYANENIGLVQSCSAYAESDLWFSPLTSQTATINMEFIAQGEADYTSGNVRLFDVTSGQQLWNYGWGAWTYIYGAPSGIDNGTSVPWAYPLYSDQDVTLTLDSDLNASDTYELIMRTGSQAASDMERESIQLSGLEPVPEPSTFALASLGTAAWFALRRRGHAAAPGVRRTKTPE